ncbi:MAG: InlB B-repeat-containing protein [Rhodoluna sp.]
MDIGLSGFNRVGSNLASTNWNQLAVGQISGLSVSADHGVTLSNLTVEIRDYGSSPLVILRTGEAFPATTKFTLTIAAGAVEVVSGSLTFDASDGATNAPSQYPNLNVSNSVSFDANGGSGSMSSMPTSNSRITIPSSTFTPPSGCTFAWWNRSADNSGSTENVAGTLYTNSDMTLFAQWFCDINFDDNGGTGSMPPQSAFMASTATQLTQNSFSRTGYNFTGWNTAANGSGTSYSDEDTTFVFTTPGSKTLYAQWALPTRTVTFDANGGTGSMSAQTGSAPALLTTNTISRNGYGFTGWNTAANGSGTAYAVDATHPFSSSETLYAQWRALPATPVAVVDIQVPVGSAIANAPVDLDVDGLKDQTGYTVTVFSTPQIIDQGTIWSGRLNTTVRIPSNLEAGWHRLVIVGTAADGTPWTEENFFKVSPGGILLATSEVVPAELAMTGSKAVPAFYGAGFLILLGFGFLAANVTLRRRNNN